MNTPFYESISSQIIRIEISTSKPRQTINLKDASATLDSSHNAKARVITPTMPTELASEVRVRVNALRTALSRLGWPMAGKGRKTSYYIPITKLTEAYDMVRLCDSDVKGIAEHHTTNWEGFKAEALHGVGDFQIPEAAFPYRSPEHYVTHFTVEVESSLLGEGSPASVLPTELAEQYMQETYKLYDRILDDARRGVAAACYDVVSKVGGVAQVKSSTFNNLRTVVSQAATVAASHSAGMDRLIGGLPKLCHTIEEGKGSYAQLSASGDAYNKTLAEGVARTLTSVADVLLAECTTLEAD